MSEKVLIFGKNTWPYTIAAREAYEKKQQKVEYVDVLSASENLDKMLKYSGGTREVPVIVEQGEVTIGFDGGTWGV